MIIANYIAVQAPTNEVLMANGSVNYSKVKMYINGVRISNPAYDFDATPGSANCKSTNNDGYELLENYRIQFDFFY